MISRVHVENFKSLRNVSVTLDRLTVLVGPNGAGKSTLLQAIHLLSQCGIRRAGEDQSPWLRFGTLFGGRRLPQRLGSAPLPTTLVLEMQEGDADVVRLQVRVPEDPTTLEVESRTSFTVTVSGSEGELSSSVPVLGSENPMLVLNHPRLRRFVSVVYLHLDANELTATSVSGDEVPRMAFDGNGLASTLAWMKGAAEDDLERITADLAAIVPGVKRIRTFRERVPHRRMDKVDIDGQPVWRPIDESLLGDRFEIEFLDGTSVPADLLSEGTVLALGLLTKLREPKRPRLVLLDDIDRGLHIEAQAKLVGVLRALLDQDPELQILCTTHSPYLLSLFAASEVRVLALDSNRGTWVSRLDEHPDFDRWRYGTQTGELWAALGHAWVVRERAASGAQPTRRTAMVGVKPKAVDTVKVRRGKS